MNISKSVTNRIDLKLETFVSLDTIVDSLKQGVGGLSVGPNTGVIILTNFGTVQGSNMTFIDEDDTDQGVLTPKEVVGYIYQKSIEFRNEHIEKIEQDNPESFLANNVSAIMLQDVKIIPHSNPNTSSSLDNLIIFTDQIVGFSFGERQ